ncbi:MAG: hypothetical protein PHE24_06040 [Patescibacteria group bacterium]|nr:hypothetical protein [Patescibacteria group bacterium]
MLTAMLFLVGWMFSASQAYLDSGLVAYYPLNGDVNDHSPNGHNGTAYNIIYDTAGAYGQCAVFNGTNSTINTNYLFNFGTGNFTISLWLNYTNLSQSASVITKRVGDVNGFDVEIVPWSTKRINFYGAENSSKVVWPPYTTDYSQGCWHNVVVVKDGINYSVYVDDTLRGTVASTVGAINMDNSYNVEFGLCRVANVRGGYYNGKLDEVRFYNRALSVAEIGQLYYPIVNNYINITSLPDMNNNGYPEIVGLAQEKSTGNPIVVIFDGNTSEQLKKITFFNAQWTPKKVTVSDINNDGLQEISVLASKTDSTKVEFRKISDGSLVRTIILP